jgi:hypothetical protein
VHPQPQQPDDTCTFDDRAPSSVQIYMELGRQWRSHLRCEAVDSGEYGKLADAYAAAVKDEGKRE